MEPRVSATGLRLSHSERDEIFALKQQGFSNRAIGVRVGRCHTTVARELARNSNAKGLYRPLSAQLRAEQRARRPKAAKLSTHPRLRAWVETKLEDEQWSPRQISNAAVDGVQG